MTCVVVKFDFDVFDSVVNIQIVQFSYKLAHIAYGVLITAYDKQRQILVYLVESVLFVYLYKSVKEVLIKSYRHCVVAEFIVVILFASVHVSVEPSVFSFFVFERLVVAAERKFSDKISGLILAVKLELHICDFSTHFDVGVIHTCRPAKNAAVYFVAVLLYISLCEERPVTVTENYSRYVGIF